MSEEKKTQIPINAADQADATPSAEPETLDADATPIDAENAATNAEAVEPVVLDPIAQLTAERDQFRDKYQRTLAEFQNYQRRVSRERQDDSQRTRVDTIEAFLFPVIDDLDRAVQAAGQHGYDTKDPLFAGVTMVHQRTFDLLKQYGIATIDAVGQPFDPEFHQALMEQPSAEVAPGTVLHLINRGYTAHGKTIRPARVVVAKAVEPTPDASADASCENETKE
jgi:molecular chaperone GrpE